MQLDDAVALKKAWGNKPCDHPDYEKEYFNGTSTGDYVCTTCGRAVWGRPEKEDEEEKKNDSQE
jgi:hypothetical protein